MDPESNYATGFIPQGISADLLATVESLDREDVDSYAAQSHQRAAKAWADGAFDRAVVPVRDRIGQPILERDETIRPEASVESLAVLEPSFAGMGELGGFDAVALQRYHWLERVAHVHTAGNSSGIVDGAALVLVGTEAAGRAAGLTPRARVVSAVVTGAEPTIMLTGPEVAARKALAKAGLQTQDISLFEVNEAFAAVPLRFMRSLGSGDRMSMAAPLPWGIRRRDGRHVAGTPRRYRRGRTTRHALCGGGMGIATIMKGSEVIRWEHADEIVILTLDDPLQSTNTMNDRYRQAMESSGQAGAKPYPTPSFLTGQGRLSGRRGPAGPRPPIRSMDPACRRPPRGRGAAEVVLLPIERLGQVPPPNNRTRWRFAPRLPPPDRRHVRHSSACPRSPWDSCRARVGRYGSPGCSASPRPC
jgi:hypothetical protein